MGKLILRAGVISIGSLILTQLIRFGGNILLAKLLAPSAFGVVSVVNLVMLGIGLVSDLGLRQVVIQRQGAITREFLNTVWTMQIARGFGIWAITIAGALMLRLVQIQGMLIGNVYADPLLPFLIVGAASGAVFRGFESTKLISQRRDLNLGRVTAIALGSQLAAMGTMIVIAKATGSPWALIAGAVVTALVQCVMSHTWLPGDRNRIYFDRTIAQTILGKSKWALVTSPLTFLQSNVEVMILGAMVNSTLLGNYMIAYLLANVMHQVCGNMWGNIFFPGLSAAARESDHKFSTSYVRFQMVSDAIVVTVAGGMIAAGSTIVGILFDHRYAMAGGLLSSLSIGLIGLRYHVIEALIQARGNFRMGMIISSVRLVSLATGTYVGFQISGLSGAAVGVGLSWFSVWPLLVWYRAKTIPFPWLVESIAILFLATGYGLGLVFNLVTISI